jgi:hypothetical protein
MVPSLTARLPKLVYLEDVAGMAKSRPMGALSYALDSLSQHSRYLHH